MRTWTRTYSEGTDCGPIDWTHPMVVKALEWLGVPIEMLKELEQHPERFRATSDGGWPRFGWRDVISASMYDGWPYWKPGPALLTVGPLGSEWVWLDSVTGLERKEAA